MIKLSLLESNFTNKLIKYIQNYTVIDTSSADINEDEITLFINPYVEVKITPDSFNIQFNERIINQLKIEKDIEKLKQIISDLSSAMDDIEEVKDQYDSVLSDIEDIEDEEMN